jgi:hypothetical protein
MVEILHRRGAENAEATRREEWRGRERSLLFDCLPLPHLPLRSLGVLRASAVKVTILVSQLKKDGGLL